jgi:hypothetical protein
MKYETRLLVFLCILLLCILGIIVKETLFQSAYKEGARTLPRPTRHPIVDGEDLNYMRPSAGLKSMNDWTDELIAQYFDENNMPYMDTISLYGSLCVSQGYTTNENKMRLKDLCFYIINNVIPSLPSVVDPKPTTILPPIQFNTTNFTAYNYNSDGLISEMTNYWSNNPDIIFDAKNIFGDYDPTAHTSIGGSDSKNALSGSQGSSGSNGSKGSGSGSGSGSDDCGITCPASCLGGMIANGADSKKGAGGLNGLGNYDSYAADKYRMSYIDPKSIYDMEMQATSPLSYLASGGYQITDMPNLYPNPDINESTLNKMINGLFNVYFDIEGGTNEPTPFALEKFDYFAKHYYPIDSAHKNKLRDLVYYFMERIIPGLPTNPDHPNSYVEWKPIRWLSHSFM